MRLDSEVRFLADPRRFFREGIQIMSRFVQLLSLRGPGTVELIALDHDGSVWRYENGVKEPLNIGWHRIDGDARRFDGVSAPAAPVEASK